MAIYYPNNLTPQFADVYIDGELTMPHETYWDEYLAAALSLDANARAQAAPLSPLPLSQQLPPSQQQIFVPIAEK